MAREIDILLAAADRGHAVVAKDTNVLWEPAELAAAGAAGRFGRDDVLAAADPHAAVSGPYPGCPQQFSSADGTGYRPVGQTTHFIIFAGPGGS